MDKITLAVEKGKALLDIYGKYLQDYIMLMPEDMTELDWYRREFTFQYWFDNRGDIKEYRANKMYGEGTLERLQQMGVDVNLVKSLGEDIQEPGSIQRKMMNESKRLALQLNSQKGKIIKL